MYLLWLFFLIHSSFFINDKRTKTKSTQKIENDKKQFFILLNGSDHWLDVAIVKKALFFETNWNNKIKLN